jgi:hypothetical protein
MLTLPLAVTLKCKELNPPDKQQLEVIGSLQIAAV